MLHIHQGKEPVKYQPSANGVKWDFKCITTNNFYKTAKKKKAPTIMEYYFNIFL